MKPYCLEIAGELACFTRPEMKVERVSYDVITPSAARSVFEAILWKPAIRWHVRRIEVLKPVRFMNLRRNEVGSKVSASNVAKAMNGSDIDLAIYADDSSERAQRASLLLRDVAYRIHADLEVRADRLVRVALELHVVGDRDRALVEARQRRLRWVERRDDRRRNAAAAAAAAARPTGRILGAVVTRGCESDDGPRDTERDLPTKSQSHAGILADARRARNRLTSPSRQALAMVGE